MSKRGSSNDDEKMIRLYKIETGNHDPCMPEVAAWAKERGFKMPKVKTDVELLAKRLSRSARLSTREVEDMPGLFPRANLAYPVIEHGERKIRWFDPAGPSATREKYAKSRTLRREGMVGDAVQYAIDDEYWNLKHPDDEPFQLDLDLTEDVLWRLNGLAAQRKKAG